jgi:hypothetical protein
MEQRHIEARPEPLAASNLLLCHRGEQSLHECPALVAPHPQQRSAATSPQAGPPHQSQGPPAEGPPAERPRRWDSPPNRNSSSPEPSDWRSCASRHDGRPLPPQVLRAATAQRPLAAETIKQIVRGPAVRNCRAGWAAGAGLKGSPTTSESQSSGESPTTSLSDMLRT